MLVSYSCLHNSLHAVLPISLVALFVVVVVVFFSFHILLRLWLSLNLYAVCARAPACLRSFDIRSVALRHWLACMPIQFIDIKKLCLIQSAQGDGVKYGRCLKRPCCVLCVISLNFTAR